MTSTEYVQKVFENELMKTGFDSIAWYASQHRAFIDKLYADKIIDDASIDKAIEARVFQQAENDYKKIIKSKINRRPIFLDDPSIQSHCLVYAWRAGRLTDRQFLLVPLDHNYTMATIGDRYPTKDLISGLRKIVLTAETPPSAMDEFLSTCAGYHCCDH